jgi:tyrosine-protein phosphatase YwqE
MFSFFRKKKAAADGMLPPPRNFEFLGADMHSHIVPGIDDGAPDPQTSLAMIQGLTALGFSKLITTPHVQREFYDNDREKITTHFSRLQGFLADQKTNVDMDVAAEYYLDNFFPQAVLPEGMLTLSGKLVLVEVSMAGWPRQIDDMIFAIQSAGYEPVLAHPERYLFEENVKVYQELKRKGVLLQMNLLAVSGYYGRSVKALASKYMDAGLYDFCGTDAHHLRHLEHLERLTQQPELMELLVNYPHWRNRSLLGEG